LLRRFGFVLASVTAMTAGAMFYACGGGSSGSGGPSAQQACTDEAATMCALLETCVTNGAVIDYGDASACVARQTTPCLTSLQANGSGRTPQNYEACAEALAMESCPDDLDNDPAPPCTAPPGSLAMGAACAFAAQCTTAFCAIPPATACGTCQPPPGAGSSCANLDTCGPGLVCVAGSCVTYGTSGDACSAAQPCGSGLTCVTPAKMTMGSCVVSGTMVGVPCDPKKETGAGCASSLGLYCNATKKQCEAQAYATAGQPCGEIAGVDTVCTGGAACIAVTTGDGGTAASCVAPAPDGQPCNTITGPPCTRPARCIGTELDGGATGTCQLPGATACM
jgi:hypothetical protein